jgi:hypothetical protein
VRLPCSGSAVTVKFKGSSSGSEPVRVIILVVFSVVVTSWAFAVGAEFSKHDLGSGGATISHVHFPTPYLELPTVASVSPLIVIGSHGEVCLDFQKILWQNLYRSRRWEVLASNMDLRRNHSTLRLGLLRRRRRAERFRL